MCVMTREETDSCVVATPGSGKTNFSLSLVYRYLSDGLAERTQIIVPTNHLRRQWALAAAEVGIQLDPAVPNGVGSESRDYHGAVVSYQQVCIAPEVWARAAERRKTVVVLDEVHHAGDSKKWGKGLARACAPAVRRLSLSGTLFRSDNTPIPFVRYEGLESVPDFTYGYGHALADGVCRPIFFPAFEGDLEWINGKGVQHAATFAKWLNEDLSRERLKAALLHREWVSAVMTEADHRLSLLREAHPQAGGLVIAMDQTHAKAVARMLEGICGEPVPVAVCDDPRASRTILQFGQSGARWLVAVKMVSEGVDIPRLRVGVYLTNVTTEMYFRQAVGRFVRVQPELPPSQDAYLYVPADPVIVEYAKSIQEERRHALREIQMAAIQEPRERSEGLGYTVTPIKGVASHHETIGIPQAVGTGNGASTAATPLFEEKDILRDKRQRLVGQVARRYGVDHRRINTSLFERTGSWVAKATCQQLHRHVQLLEWWINHGYDGLR